MPNLEWDVAHTLITPYATIDLNAETGFRYVIQPDGYEIVPALRVTQDAVSQADGSVLHPRWKTGLVATIEVELWTRDETGAPDVPACAQFLRYMGEQLSGALNSIRRETGGTQRLLWTPSGYGDRRMLTDIQTLSWLAPSYTVNGEVAVLTFSVETPFPYAIDATQTDTPVDGSASITNAGNADYSPVVQVHGPFSAFTLTNLSDIDDDGNPRSVVYDDSRPGAVPVASGHYAEIDFFKGTIFLDGDLANLIAGLDPTETDFWHLVPGTNAVEITGATCDVLSNNAWS